MKKILTALVLAVFAFVACNDDDDSFTPKKPAATFAGQLPTKVGNYSLEYDEFGRCVTAKYYNDTEFEIDYAKGTITLYDDDITEEANVKFNKQGYITEISMTWDYKDEYGTYKGSGTISYKYNGEGQLISAKAASQESGVEDGEKFNYKMNGESNYTWSNGNLTKSDIQDVETGFGEEDKDHTIYTITYGEEKNKAGQNTHVQADVYELEDCDVLVQIGLFGKSTAFLPTSYIEEWYEDGKEDPSDYENTVRYILNEDGTIQTEYINNTPYNYTYTTIEEPSSKSTSLKENNRKPSLRSIFVKRHNKR